MPTITVINDIRAGCAVVVAAPPSSGTVSPGNKKDFKTKTPISVTVFTIAGKRPERRNTTQSRKTYKLSDIFGRSASAESDSAESASVESASVESPDDIASEILDEEDLKAYIGYGGRPNDKRATIEKLVAANVKDDEE